MKGNLEFRARYQFFFNLLHIELISVIFDHSLGAVYPVGIRISVLRFTYLPKKVSGKEGDRDTLSVLFRYSIPTMGAKNIDAQYENSSLLWETISPEPLGLQ